MPKEIKKCRGCKWPQNSYGCFQSTRHDYLPREYQPVWNRDEIKANAVTASTIEDNVLDVQWIKDHGSSLDSLRRGIEQATRGELIDRESENE